MKKFLALGLVGYALLASAMNDTVYNVAPKHKPVESKKSELTKKQRKARAKTKAARKARRK